MKKLFSNKDAERIEQLENHHVRLNGVIQAKDRQIGDLQSELEQQGRRLSDALMEKDHQASVSKTEHHDAIIEQLRVAKAQAQKQSETAAHWQTEAEKAYRARDNAKAGFTRLKKKIARLETS